MQLIWVSRDPRGRREGDPSGCVYRSRRGGVGSGVSQRPPGSRYWLRGGFSSPWGLSRPGLTQRGPRSGVWTTALRGRRRGAPPLRVPGAARRPPAPLPAVPRGPRRHSPRSGSTRPVQAPVVAAVGPLYGALWEPRERALGPWRGRCRELSMVPPARRLERPGRCAGGARGPSGAGRTLTPLLSSPPPRRGALGLRSRHGRRRVGMAALAAGCVSPAAASAAPWVACGLLGSGRLPALLPMHG